MGAGAGGGEPAPTGSVGESAFEEEQFTLVVGGQELWVDDVCRSKWIGRT